VARSDGVVLVDRLIFLNNRPAAHLVMGHPSLTQGGEFTFHSLFCAKPKEGKFSIFFFIVANGDLSDCFTTNPAYRHRSFFREPVPQSRRIAMIDSPAEEIRHDETLDRKD